MEMLDWDAIVDFLQRAKISGLLWEGFWDGDVDPRRFHRLSSPVYVDTDLGMLKVDFVDDSYLSFEVVDAPVWAHFDESERGEAGLIDLGYSYFGDRTTVQCQELRCAYLTDAAASPGQVAMMSFATDGGEVVTFDPWNFSGLRVQGGVHLEAVLAKTPYIAAVTTVRAWTR
jgi:hypothetical protein